MKRLFTLSIIIFLNFCFLSSLWAQSETVEPASDISLLQEKQAKMVKAIEIEGNKTISIPVILAKIKTRVGQEYLPNVIKDDLKRLYNTGYFSDVSVDRKDYEDGFKVIFYLEEKPVIEKISFSRTRFYGSRALLAKMRLREGQFLDKKILKDDRETIKSLYVKKGLTLAEVDVEIDMDQKTNKARLHFVVKEGQRVRIKRIIVEGNKSFPYKRIIKTIKTRADSLFTSGYLKDELLTEDMERVRLFYEKEGFIDAKVSFSQEYERQGRLVIKIMIVEGKKYFVGRVDMTGNVVASTDEILKTMQEIKLGKVFSRQKLDVDLAAIRSLYFDKGYIFAHVEESTALNPESGEVEITLHMKEGGLAYVNKIKIEGNSRTRDIVIRRELRLHPGDQFDGVQLRRSKERLKNLGFFDEISYDIRDTDVSNQKDLVVQVKEAKTGTFSFGGGYSTIDQVVGFVEVEQKNFDFTNWPTFTGGGQNLLIHAEAGSVRSNTRLSFTEPWLFDYPISGGFDLYRTQRLRERDVGYAYDEERLGGDLRLGKELAEYLSGSVTYRIEEITIDNLEDGVSTDLAREVGDNVVSSLSFNLTQDKRDNVFNPTKGLYLSGTFDVAGGGLGGDKDFFRFVSKASYDLPLKFESVLEFRARAGWADAYGDSEFVPIFERFFAGGARTIRGYNERRVGPIDTASEDPIGGESLLVGNVEYLFPIVDFIKLAGFFDAGNVWSKVSDFGSGGFKSGTGLGLRVKTPIGPVNLDYGYPLNEEPGEERKEGKFYFSVSRGF